MVALKLCEADFMMFRGLWVRRFMQRQYEGRSTESVLYDEDYTKYLRLSRTKHTGFANILSLSLTCAIAPPNFPLLAKLPKWLVFVQVTPTSTQTLESPKPGQQMMRR